MNRNDYDDNRGGSNRGRSNRGWQGDPEGHSEASARGWKNRRGGRSRSSDYDDDDDRGRGSSSRSRRSGDGRGWYGDPEGHSEASERGWEHRQGGRGRSSYDDDDRGRDDDRG